MARYLSKNTYMHHISSTAKRQHSPSALQAEFPERHRGSGDCFHCRGVVRVIVCRELLCSVLLSLRCRDTERRRLGRGLSILRLGRGCES